MLPYTILAMLQIFLPFRITHLPGRRLGIGDKYDMGVLVYSSSSSCDDVVSRDGKIPGAIALTRTGICFNEKSVAICIVRCVAAALRQAYANYI